jgi:formamidopyrimidine-DNA glycosylase
MPELAEVETIARILRDGTNNSPGIVGKTIRDVVIHWHKTLAIPDELSASKWTIGKQILSVGRRGKFIQIELDGIYFIFIHLRMSGDLQLITASTERIPQHIRAELEFSDGSRMVFNDPRKFGRIWITDHPQDVIGNLGIDPFDDQLTCIEFTAMLKNKHRQIKALLLDQTFISGMGNIYTDESLHRAGIHPRRDSYGLTNSEMEKLLFAIREVLTEGINRNGSSIDWVYRGGDFQNYFRVYGRKDQPCPVCGTAIARILVGQRGTHFCPHCQPEERSNEM